MSSTLERRDKDFLVVSTKCGPSFTRDLEQDCPIVRSTTYPYIYVMFSTHKTIS